MVKRISPIKGVLDTMKAISTNDRSFRNTALNWENNGIVVDTCCAFDTGKWETGIERNGDSWIIVEQYEDKEEAITGHKKWIEKMKKNPKMKLTDINLWNL